MSETVNITKENALKAYNSADKKGKELLETLLGKESFKPKSVMDIQTFEDVLIINGDKAEDILPYNNPKNKRQSAANDHARLDYIAEYLQNGYVADWSNQNEKKWFPIFEYNDKASGFGFSCSFYVIWFSHSGCGSRFALPSEEISNFFGKQFIEIHNRLLTNKY